MIFRACDASGCEPWVSDGTEAGTRRLADVEPGTIGSAPAFFTPAGPLVYFSAQTSAAGWELWAVPTSALVDADGDSVRDDLDNCPTTANADQADLDADGQGDPCDADRDGDGVPNAADRCPDSTPDQPVDASGCTAEERIALRCPPEEFPNRGGYVSCVAHAAGEAVRDGLIGPAGKRRFVKRAARLE